MLSDVDKVLYTMGLFPHPGDFFPGPTEMDPVYCHKDDPSKDDFSVSGNIFMDGSCFRSVVKELSRAGWSYVSVSDSGQELGHVYAPLASPLPQTAQAGEFGACTAACQNAVAPARGYSDCQNVVELWAGTRA